MLKSLARIEHVIVMGDLCDPLPVTGRSKHINVLPRVIVSMSEVSCNIQTSSVKYTFRGIYMKILIVAILGVSLAH
jgi:hypothetical protein